MNSQDAKRVLETALICASQPLPLRDMRVLFADEIGPSIRWATAQVTKNERRSPGDGPSGGGGGGGGGRGGQSSGGGAPADSGYGYSEEPF